MLDRDNDGAHDYYLVPIYKLFIQGTDPKGITTVKNWEAIRFSPYWNDPKNPNKNYNYKGFTAAGLTSFPRQKIKQYIRSYEIHNTNSPFNGAIQLKGNFLIHAGPLDINDYGWGGAGCIEIIGNFEKFKREILNLANCKITDLHQSLEEIIKHKKLSVEIFPTERPQLVKYN